MSTPGQGLLTHKRLFVIAAIVAICLIVVWFAVRAALDVDNPIYVVSHESMLPTLQVGDLAIIRNGQGYSFNDLSVGDIIVFHSDDAGGRVIIHRIAEIYTDNQTGERLVKTKGDNNPQSYEGVDYPIKEGDYYGKVVSVIPKVGILSAKVHSP